MKELNKEILEELKQVKTVEDLMNFAKVNNLEITEEEAKDYFQELEKRKGELKDEDLEDVAGGGYFLPLDKEVRKFTTLKEWFFGK